MIPDERTMKEPSSAEDPNDAVDETVLVSKLPSIPSSDDFPSLAENAKSCLTSDGSIDARLHRLRSVTHSVVAAQKLRRTSSLQGKYVAITPNERDNLEHIQHMTEDITARLDRLRDDDDGAAAAADSVEASETTHPSDEPHGPLYLAGEVRVRGKFVQVVSFDGCSDRDDGHVPPPQNNNEGISPFPPLPPSDSFAFVNGDVDEMEEDNDGDDATASLEQRLRLLTDERSQ